MNRIIFLAAVLLICACQHIPADDNKKEKKMAELLFEETFENNNFRSRGWTGGLNAVGGYHFEHDSIIGRNVAYARWIGRQTGVPDGIENTTYRALPLNKAADGFTFHIVVKTHNMLQQAGGAHHHAYMLRFFTYEARGNVGNTNGEFVLDGFNQLPGTYGEWPTAFEQDYSPRGTFYMQNQSAGIHPLTSERHIVQNRGTQTEYLFDDVWYEVAVHVDTDDGGSNGRAIIVWRRYGEGTWNTAFRHEGVRLAGVSGQLARIQNVGFGPYFHVRTNSNEARSYAALMRAYVGNAIDDGTLDGPINPPGPGTPPENGNGETPPGDLEISNISEKVDVTSATITWETNKDANSVVDYGPTPNRGTWARDDSFTQDHTVVLADLAPETQYFYRFSSKTANGEVVLHEENRTFTTKSEDVNPEPSEDSLNDLTDVTITSPKRGHVLVYDGSKWSNANLNLDQLVDQKVREVLANATVKSEGSTTIYTTGKIELS